MDILDSFDEIKIGVAYKLDGKVLDSMPGTYHCNTVTLCVTKSVAIVLCSGLLEEEVGHDF